MAKKIYGRSDVGCYADGAGGQEHIRAVLADILGYFRKTSEIRALIAELEDEPSDDMSEEDDAIELLNSITAEGFSWGMSNGDLMLLSNEDWEASP